MAKRKQQVKQVEQLEDKPTLHNEMALAWVSAETARGNVAKSIRDSLTSPEGRSFIAEAAGELYEMYGRRERIAGTDQFTPSTPFDSFNTQVQTVSSETGKKLKPAFNQVTDLWELVEVKSKPVATSKGKGKGKASTGKSKVSGGLTEVRARHAELMNDRTFDEKVSELEHFADLLGIGLDRSHVVDFKATKMTSKSTSKKRVSKKRVSKKSVRKLAA